MSHHHRIIVPAITDRPTCAGEWIFTGSYVEHVAGRGYDEWGWWELIVGLDKRVLVTETPGAGRICRELRMGGHALCGLAQWSGRWRKA